MLEGKTIAVAKHFSKDPFQTRAFASLGSIPISPEPGTVLSANRGPGNRSIGLLPKLEKSFGRSWLHGCHVLQVGARMGEDGYSGTEEALFDHYGETAVLP